MISIVLVTYNRLHLLEQCVEHVLGQASEATKEIIIWDNASTDGTADYVAGLTDPRLRVVRHPTNIGTKAFARAFRLARCPYLIELDDDVIDAPPGWDVQLLEAFRKVPALGFLAAHVQDDGRSTACEILYRRDRHLYHTEETNGVRLLVGPTGGWCSMTSREVYDQVGGFREDPRFVYWHEDGAYVNAVEKAGYRAAILETLKVLHAAGPAYSYDAMAQQERDRYNAWRRQRAARRNAVKQFLERIPPCRWLNATFHFYSLPRPLPENTQS